MKELRNERIKELKLNLSTVDTLFNNVVLYRAKTNALCLTN